MRDDIVAHKVKLGLVRMANIKNIIAITSGKGGVGKSTTAVNLAIAMAKTGASVGLLDADIYGPSVPMLVGERDFKPDVRDACFLPLEKYGIKILSFGFLIDEKQPAIWRGAIVNKALNQLMFDTMWGELDYLIIDMPPGTGDVHLTMCQKMPITGVVSVTTPQDISLVDVTKSVEMYKKLGLNCLGVIENMSTHICSNCGHIEAIFGNNGGAKLAAAYNLPLLAKLPLDINICTAADTGVPITLDLTNSVTQLYTDLVLALEVQLAKLPKDYSAKIGKVATLSSK